MSWLLFAAALFLAYSNGANDNFKGVATLFGTGTANYKRSLTVATLSTLAGSICSIFLAAELVKNFSGRGLIPDALLSTHTFTAVAVGAALTVMLATRIGMPVSTTHGLVGGLVGAGLSAGVSLNLAKLGGTFVLPLIASPLIAACISLAVFSIVTYLKRDRRIPDDPCICTEADWMASPINADAAVAAEHGTRLRTGARAQCESAGAQVVATISLPGVVDALHYFSAGAVSFARGLNDTPKIAGLILLSQGLPIRYGMLLLALSIAIGGALNARRVAETMSKKITTLTRVQGLSANLVTALLVGTASWNGLPVSTTHVSVGSIFGMGVATKSANPKVISEILLSWVLTLPLAAAVTGLVYFVLGHITQ
ncbi:MAG: inorganic phosphate transporter [Leptospirales bacterium]|nr:inorganic phosphate transporter [Leptospirales bacterium]